MNSWVEDGAGHQLQMRLNAATARGEQVIVALAAQGVTARVAD